jgi:hypothetical protein
LKCIRHGHRLSISKSFKRLNRKLEKNKDRYRKMGDLGKVQKLRSKEF